MGSNWLSGYPLGGFTSNRIKHESIVWFQSSSYQSKHYVLLKKGGLTSCSCAVDAPSAWCMVRFNALKRWVMRSYHSHWGVPSLLQQRLKPVLLMWRITWAHVVNHISGLNHIISKWHTSPKKCFNQFLSEWPYICYIFGKVLVQLAKNITNYIPNYQIHKNRNTNTYSIFVGLPETQHIWFQISIRFRCFLLPSSCPPPQPTNQL